MTVLNSPPCPLFPGREGGFRRPPALLGPQSRNLCCEICWPRPASLLWGPASVTVTPEPWGTLACYYEGNAHLHRDVWMCKRSTSKQRVSQTPHSRRISLGESFGLAVSAYNTATAPIRNSAARIRDGFTHSGRPVVGGAGPIAAQGLKDRICDASEIGTCRLATTPPYS